MWKSGFSLRAAMFFSPQASCGYSELIHTGCAEKIIGEFLIIYPQVIFPHSTTPVEN
jgi:hypothetical protein